MKRSAVFEELVRVMKMCEENGNVEVHRCVKFINPIGDFFFCDDENMIMALRNHTDVTMIRFAERLENDSPVFNA